MAGEFCGERYNSACAIKLPLKCTEYFGILPTNTDLDVDGCHSGLDIIEDIINILDNIQDEIDLKDFGCCIEYEPSDKEEGLTLRDILETHEGAICELKEEIDKCCNGNTDRDDSDDCYKEMPCENGLVYYSSETTQAIINSSTWSNVSTYNLKYKTQIKGVYKVTLEVYTDVNPYDIGVSIDGVNPDNGIFSSVSISPNTSPATVTFILDLNKAVNIVPYFKSGANTAINSIKMIVEKVK